MPNDLFSPALSTTASAPPAPVPNRPAALDHPDAPALRDWLRLVLTPGVGPVTARRLLQLFGSPAAVFDAPTPALRAAVGPALLASLAEIPPHLPRQLELTQRWLATAQPGTHPRRLLTLDDPAYPRCLASLADAPVLLYLEGDISRLTPPGIAVVGSRKCTAQGRAHARHFASQLSQAGVPVISGLALGIDGIAHQAALEGPGSTIAVVATGLDTVYPQRHRELASHIAQAGLMVSEFALGTLSQPIQFPRRNRLIAGLSRGVLVVEAALPSGTLITAQFAADQGRDVFALPGPLEAPLSRGCHHLIKQGARLVETVEDILEELALPVLPRRPSSTPPTAPAKASPPSPPVRQASEGTASTPAAQRLQACDPLLDLLACAALTLDELSNRCGLGIPTLQTRLLELELSGRVTRLPGGLYQARGLT